MDFNLLCRLCAKEDRLCIQVFGTEGIKQNVAKKIGLCLPIVVTESDDFPKQICLNCLSNLDTSYELYTRCLEAQSVIKNMIMVNRQNGGEVVKVYSTQEMLKMISELRDKICEKRPAVRLGNTVFTIRDAGSNTEDSSNDEQRAKKRKQEVMKTSGRSMMYPAGPFDQRYMLIPSTTMPPTMIPSAVPEGQFAIVPLPTAKTYPLSPIQVLQTPVRTSVVQTNNADIHILTPESVPQTSKVTKISSTQIRAVPSSASTVHKPSATEVASVQSIQHVPATRTAQSSMLSRGSAPKVQQTSMPEVTSVSELAVQPQITSVQSAIQTFQNSSPVHPTMSLQVPVSSKFTLSNRTGKTFQSLQNTSSLSETTSQIASIQLTVQALPEIATIQTKQEREKQNVEESPSEILPLISNDSLGPKEFLSISPPQQASTQGTKMPQSQITPLIVNMGDGDDDDDGYAADDPDPLHINSEEDEQDKTEEETAADSDPLHINSEEDEQDKTEEETAADLDPLHINSEEDEQDKTEVETAADSDPLHINSEDDEQDKTEDETAADSTVIESVLELHDKNRNVIPATVEEVSSDSSVADGQINKHMCPYCKKFFPEDVIFHHKKLHFRQTFFSCITCNKNFRTEAGLESHHCE